MALGVAVNKKYSHSSENIPFSYLNSDDNLNPLFIISRTCMYYMMRHHENYSRFTRLLKSNSSERKANNIINECAYVFGLHLAICI